MSTFKTISLSKTTCAAVEMVRASLHNIAHRPKLKSRWIQADLYEEASLHNNYPTDRVIGMRILLQNDLLVFATCAFRKDSNCSESVVDIILPHPKRDRPAIGYVLHCVFNKDGVQVKSAEWMDLDKGETARTIEVPTYGFVAHAKHVIRGWRKQYIVGIDIPRLWQRTDD